MIELTQSLGSPFVRKVRIAAAVKGLQGQVNFIDPEKDKDRNEALRAANPLAKVPAARLEDGSLIFDSHVLCEYLDSLAPPATLFPPAGPERWRTLTLASLADGIMEAAILVVYEGRFRPEEKWHQPWLDKQQSKIDSAIRYLEATLPPFKGQPDYGDITLACALGYLDLRQAGQWRREHPRLVTWLNSFAAAVPAFAATEPPR